MNKFFLGFGGCSKYYKYILGTVLFKCIRDCMFGFNTINPDSKIGLFGFIPELSNHFLIQSLYRYSSFMLGGALFIYISRKKLENETEKISNKEKESLEFKGLIHNRKSDGSEIAKIRDILKISLIYCVHAELSRIMYLFDFSGLDFWTVDVLFILLFMHLNFVINYGRHQKYSMIFIILSVTTLLLISSFLPNTNHDDVKEEKIKDNNTYQSIKYTTGSNYAFIIIFLTFSLLSCLISYQRVKEKVLMDFYFLSPYRLIFYIGLVGFIITSITLIIVSNLKCYEKQKYIKEHCYITRLRSNKTEYYYDNFAIYFEELKNNVNSYKVYLEIIIIPPIYIAISFLEFSCEILTINYLNPNFVLLRDNIYYGTSRLIFFLFNIHKNYKHYMTLSQFIILEMAEILAIIGYAVYLEIIELRFFGLDKDLKRNIIKRGFRETPLKPVECSFDENEIFEESIIEEGQKNQIVESCNSEF